LTILIFEEEKRAVFVRALVAQTWLDRFLIWGAHRSWHRWITKTTAGMDKHFPLSINISKNTYFALETANNAHKSIASDRMHQILCSRPRHDCSAALRWCWAWYLRGVPWI
jgi:hypothetical protein